MAKNSTIGRYASGKAKDFALKSALDEDGNPTENFEKVVSKVLDIQRPLVLKHIQRVAAKNPGDTPEQLAERLGQQYLNAVTGAGAAVGGTAIVPGIGTVAALGLSAAATVGFMEATALYAQSLAELHGITLEDPQRSEALVMAVMLGDDAKELLREAAAKSGRPFDPNASLNALAGSAAGTGSGAGVSAFVMDRLKRTFMKKMLVRQGAGFLGRAVPFGVGAVIGGVGNRAMGKAVMENTQELFGPLPTVIPGEIREGVVKASQDGDDDGGGVFGALRRALPGGGEKKDEKEESSA